MRKTHFPAVFSALSLLAAASAQASGTIMPYAASSLSSAPSQNPYGALFGGDATLLVDQCGDSCPTIAGKKVTSCVIYPFYAPVNDGNAVMSFIEKPSAGCGEYCDTSAGLLLFGSSDGSSWTKIAGETAAYTDGQPHTLQGAIPANTKYLQACRGVGGAHRDDYQIVSINAASVTNAFDVWMSASGSDSNKGLTQETAVATLTRATGIVSSKKFAGPVTIHIRPDTYYQQSTSWNYYSNGYPIYVNSSGWGTPGIAIFNGCVEGQVNDGVCDEADSAVLSRPFTYQLPIGLPGTPAPAGQLAPHMTANLVLQGIQVEYYLNGIEITSDGVNHAIPDDNVIDHVTHTNLGSAYFSQVDGKSQMGYSGLAIHYSSGNTITNDTFTNLVDDDGNESEIHAIYCSYFCSDNTIQYNSFTNISGEVVDFRNLSNSNTVANNTFQKIGTDNYQSGALDWYCPTSECSAPPNYTIYKEECPSWNNSFISNALDGTGSAYCRAWIGDKGPYDCADSGLSNPSNYPSDCPIPEGAARFIDLTGDTGGHW